MSTNRLQRSHTLIGGDTQKKINRERKRKRMGTWGKDAGKRTREERGRGGQR